MALTERAGVYLENLRTSALLVGVLLLFLGVAGGVTVIEVLAAVDVAKPTLDWGTHMAAGLTFAYALVAGAWLGHFLRISSALGRWRARAAVDPLEA